MVAIAADPLVMTAVKFSLEDPDAPGTFLEYECHVSSAEIAAEQETITHQTLCPEGSFTALGRESFSLAIVAVQDWSASGLTRFLWENAGREALARFQPNGSDPISADNPSWECAVILPRPSVGGEVNTFATSEITLPIKGVPTLDVAP